MPFSKAGEMLRLLLSWEKLRQEITFLRIKVQAKTKTIVLPRGHLIQSIAIIINFKML